MKTELLSYSSRGISNNRRKNRNPIARAFCFTLIAFSLWQGNLFAQTAQPKAGDPLNGLTIAQTELFNKGQLAFDDVFSVAEGLGPVFNKDSCAGCHSVPAIGGSGNISVTRFGRAEKGMPFDPLDNFGGSLRQAEAISMSCAEDVPAEANVTAERITTSVFGIGLIELIDDADIIANETAQAASGTSIQGAVHWVPTLEDPMAPLKPGRFGWKAQLASVLSFSGDASLNEMGITNRIVGDENAPNGDPALLAACDMVADPEDVPDMEGVEFVDRVTDFQRFLAGPPQTPQSGMAGEAIFNSIGCVTCHVSTYTTVASPVAALSNQVIKPYSDFLLHDMGILGDGIVQGDASEFQMRTPPLWGLRHRDPMLHDGRASAGTFESRVTTAILEHAGEALDSRNQFAALDAAQTASLMTFLDSLGRAEFDADNDNFISNSDFESFAACFTGPGSFYTPDDECSIHDVDQDGDVDADDFAVFMSILQETPTDCDLNSMADMEEIILQGANDCNQNGQLDACELTAGTAFDTNMNLVLDVCERFLRGDCNHDGAIDVADGVHGLAYLFSGGEISCEDSCDNNNDGTLDIADPVYVLSYLFGAGPDLAEPFTACGVESDNDGINCFNPTCP